MKKARSLISVLAIFILSALVFSEVYSKKEVLSTAVTLNASTTVVNGAGGVTWYDVTLPSSVSPIIGVTMTFTRAAGSDSTVQAFFQVSFDAGTTWSDLEGQELSVATNHVVISGTTVRVTEMLAVYGVNRLRVKHFINNDGANNVTALQLTVTLERR